MLQAHSDTYGARAAIETGDTKPIRIKIAVCPIPNPGLTPRACGQLTPVANRGDILTEDRFIDEEKKY